MKRTHHQNASASTSTPQRLAHILSPPQLLKPTTPLNHTGTSSQIFAPETKFGSKTKSRDFLLTTLGTDSDNEFPCIPTKQQIPQPPVQPPKPAQLQQPPEQSAAIFFSKTSLISQNNYSTNL
jgi:hypothetical protein